MACGLDPTQSKLVVHVDIDIDIDNASAYNARVAENFFEQNPPKRLPHPPDSPDISPSDFDVLSFRESDERADWTRDF
jgi:hypothetical protein